MHNVKMAFTEHLEQLQAERGVQFGPAAIAAATGGKMSRQHVDFVLSTDPHRFDLKTLGAMLDFFAYHGKPLTISDLLQVEVAQPATRTE